MGRRRRECFKESWDILIPTIREDGSQIIVSFNPKNILDDTYQRFVIHPPERCKSVLVNWQDNPYFPKELMEDMEQMREVKAHFKRLPKSLQVEGFNAGGAVAYPEREYIKGKRIKICFRTLKPNLGGRCEIDSIKPIEQ